jgi:hypothetical protein
MFFVVLHVDIIRRNPGSGKYINAIFAIDFSPIGDIMRGLNEGISQQPRELSHRQSAGAAAMPIACDITCDVWS